MSTEATEPTVIVERRGHAGILTLNRPRAINALTHEMVGLIQRALDTWSTDPSIATVAITGAGDRGLCAGGDIVSIYHDALSGQPGTEEFWRGEYRLNAAIAGYPKPVVALMDGLVLGGGVGISAHASHRVVTDRTRIGMPEVGIGFVPDVGGTWLLSRSPGELGTFIALTAGQVDGADAIALGLADHHVRAEFLTTLLDLLGVVAVDEAITEVANPVPQSPLLADRDWIDAAFRHDTVVEIATALEQRPEAAAADAAAAVRRNSPTSVVVTLRALRTARELTLLEDALRQEYRIAVRMLRGHDFPEGIRAQVIDKDRNPRWQPPALDELEPAVIESHFASLGTDELTFDTTATASGAFPTRSTKGTP